ncbi:phospholipase A [Alicycliphilus denitrificans]|uniref:Phospholipase A1 n=1 Tax=Alicycliphilus denitrificans TaxID=179636 RepID=A0A420KDM4_9BURK|nr:phospholipase A [Alicycliphilus denitrificans]RKJ97310.1 phospholipase [Alicycliphilus denitrificans]
MTRALPLPLRCCAALLGAALPLASPAQPAAPAAGDAGWRQCAALAGDSQARLACFDRWAGEQAWQAPAASANAQPAAPGDAPPPPVDAAPPATHTAEAVQVDGCRDAQYGTLSRFWELEAGSDCGAFRFRGYRPMTVSVVGANNVNRQPTSGNPENNATSPIDYRRTEMRMQLSVRTKLAQGLLPRSNPGLRDSLWFGYTQQSYWQLFSPDISRPFRNTDHEPEIVYVYPTDARLPWGWRWRYSGLGLVHQSNGQSLPLSRSWNRVYLMSGMELADRWRITGRIWKRLHESAANDDNPGISNYVGRAELGVAWTPNPDNTLSLTARHSLGATARGSVRLEWLQSLGTSFVGRRTNLRLHTQLFSGYGDSLIDYNRRRTVFSVGVSLVDF